MFENISSALEARTELVKQRARLIRAVTEIDGEIGEVHDFIAQWHHFASISSDEPGEIYVDVSRSPSLVGRNPRKEVVAAKAAEILRASGVPMKTAELLSALRRNGIVLHGKRPRAILNMMLFRLPSVVVRAPDRRRWMCA